MRRIIQNAGKYIVVLGIIIAIIVFNRGITKVQLLADDNTEFAKAVVTGVENSDLQGDAGETDGTTQRVTLLIKSGTFKGQTIPATSMNGYLYGAHCELGTKVIAKVSEYNGSVSGSVYNYDRETEMAVLTALFLGLMWLIGGKKKGFNSILALIFTFIVIIMMYVPLMYIGCPPFWAAVISVIIISVVSIILIADISKKSASAIAGTICGVVVAGIISVVFGKAAHINGNNVDEIESLIYIGQQTRLDVSNMLYSGMLIASLGAVMDVAMSVSTTLNELCEVDNTLTFKKLFKSGMNVGRDMIGTMSNTLILAFVGSSINTIMIIYSYSYQMHQIVNMYSIGIEIMRGIAGTMGIILTVPFTSAIAAFLLSGKKSLKAGKA
ncbi:MAG: YibE/F family protein [Butyrivibrio sp.]